jgi:hypothetical protein
LIECQIGCEYYFFVNAGVGEGAGVTAIRVIDEEAAIASISMHMANAGKVAGGFESADFTSDVLAAWRKESPWSLRIFVGQGWAFQYAAINPKLKAVYSFYGVAVDKRR